MMWRYYELLTDVQVTDIERLKGPGMHPMDAKKALAYYIVKDFHSAAEAQKAGEGWVRQFQKHGMPEELECVDVQLATSMLSGVRQVFGGHSSQENKRLIRLEKLIPAVGLAASNTEAAAKCKQKGTVELFDLNGQPFAAQVLVAMVPINEFFVLRVGRRMKKVRILESTSG
jgi:tyrosyl-tRNA synthetase